MINDNVHTRRACSFQQPRNRVEQLFSPRTMEALCRSCSILTAVRAVPFIMRCALPSSSVTVPARWNSNRAAVAKTNRKVHSRAFPTVVVNTDGSTFRIRYPEPRKILKLPVDVNMLAMDERKARLARYQPKKKVKVMDDLDDNFDAGKYRHLWNKRK